MLKQIFREKTLTFVGHYSPSFFCHPTLLTLKKAVITMNTNDILLLAILAAGVVWMNWTTIKGDLFRNGDAPASYPSDKHLPSVRPTPSREEHKEAV